jgi:hypothetical protein
VLGPRFDVLAHNQPAELILDDLLTWPPGRRNLLRWLFQREKDDLIRSSESFRSWWADHDVLALTSAVKQIPHRRFGPLRLRQLQTRPEHRPELRLRILVPDDAATRQALTPST